MSLGTHWPDFEAAATRYLADALAKFDAHVGAVKLPDRALQVIVRDDGGEPLPCGFLSTARLGVNVYAQSDGLAEHVGAHVTAALNGWADGNPVVTCQASRAHPIADAEQPNRYLVAEAILIGPTLT